MFLMILYILWTLTPLRLSECSEIIDGLEQKGIYISDYCPKIGSCTEGSHVMCMFYNPHSVMGPRCSNPQNISITPDIANKMLEIANAVRSKIARGKETGKDGKELPKGYGLFRLKWDSELATFAQVLANQCVLRHDICRASKKFTDPGQAAGLVRFSNPHWFPVSPNIVFNVTGLTLQKVHYATTQSVKSWYSHKDHVTVDMISNYPDWTRHPENLRGRLYLEMIFGPATHMGCGISAYSEWAYHDNKADLTYNSIQTICNFSSRPRSGKPVYQTTPPTQPGYTARCGCPEGYEEDADCLCNEIPSPLEICGKKSCNPSVILLPIFTVEDAPQHLLLEDQSQDMNVEFPKSVGRNNTLRAMRDNSIEDIFGPYELYGNDAVLSTRSPILSPVMHYVQPRMDNSVRVNNDPKFSRLSRNKFSRNDFYSQQGQRPGQNILRSVTHHQLRDVKNRYFNNKIPNTSPRHVESHSLQQGYDHVPNRKPTLRIRSSIFTRSNTFHLPSDRTFTLRSDIKRDVAPRKDFTKGKLVLDTYLTKKRNHEDISSNALNFDIKPNVKGTISIHPRFKVIETTENNKPHTDFNRYLKNKFHYQDFNISHHPGNEIDIKNSYEEGDSKLMTLLDTLEQEVKHIELDGNKKEIFDAKIRKIYDTVAQKASDLKSPLHTRTEFEPEDAGYNNYLKSETEVTNHLATDHHMDDQSKNFMRKSMFKSKNKIKEIDSKLSDRFSDPKSMFLKKSRAHNSLLPYNEIDNMLPRHYKETDTYDIYGTEMDDPNLPMNKDMNEALEKSMIRYADTNKNIPSNDDPRLKHFKDIREENDLKERTRINNYITNENENSNIDKHSFNENELIKMDKNFDYRDKDKRYGEETKNRLTFRHPSSDLELRNRDVDQTLDDYSHSKKRSSNDHIKNRNQMREFIGDGSLKSRSIYRKDGRIRHRYDDESIKRHNYDENLIEFRRNNHGIRQDIDELPSRNNDNGIRHIKNYKDYGQKEHEIAHGDPISLDRRKYYQSKIDNIERKLQNSQTYRRRYDHGNERALRLDRANHEDELHLRPSSSSKNQNQFYIPDRARILHGF